MRVDALLVADVCSKLPAGSRVLDLPVGNGRLSRQLDAAGMQVVSADLVPKRVRARVAPLVRTDMNSRLPFAPSSLDGIVCQEGIEHLEDPAGFIRECRRAIREGGHLWITTPNVMDLSSRWSQFLTGMKSFRTGFPNEGETVLAKLSDATYLHGHAFTLPFFQIRYLLRIQQFDDVEPWGFNRSAFSTVLFPLVWPWTGLLVRRALRRRRGKMRHGLQRRSRGQLVDELVRHAASTELLCFRKLVIRARRVEGSFALAVAPDPGVGAEG